MEHIYIAMVDTPGIFAAVIRGFLKQRYIHVVIGLDAELQEAYSFGRRNPRIPFFAGFEREDKEKILRAFRRRRTGSASWRAAGSRRRRSGRGCGRIIRRDCGIIMRCRACRSLRSGAPFI